MHGAIQGLRLVGLREPDRLVLIGVELGEGDVEDLHQLLAAFAGGCVDLVLRLGDRVAVLDEVGLELLVFRIGRCENRVLLRAHKEQDAFLQLGGLFHPARTADQKLGGADHVRQLHIADRAGDHGQQDDDAEGASKLGFDGESHVSLVGSNWGAYA